MILWLPTYAKCSCWVQPIFNDSSVILIAQWDRHPAILTGDTCEAASKVVDQVEARIKAVILGAVNMG